MKRTSKIAAFAVACLMTLATSAFAIPDQWKASMPVSLGEPAAIAVSPNDRWVFVASEVTAGTGVIQVIDTWTWEQRTSVTLPNAGAQPVDIIASKDGAYLYVTDTMGYLTQIVLAPLGTFVLGSTLSLSTVRDCQVDTTGAALGELTTAPMPGFLETSINQYIMVGVPGNGGAGVGTGGPGIATFEQGDVSDGTCAYIAASSSILGNDGIPMGMAAGVLPSDIVSPFDYLAHIALDFSSGAADSHAILPFATPSTPSLISPLNVAANTYALGGMAVNDAGDKVFIAASDESGNEVLFTQTGTTADTWIPAASITLATSARDISIADTVTDPGRSNESEALYVAATGPTAGDSDLYIYYADTLDPATTVIDFTGATLTDVAASSAIDGYVYVAGSNATTGLAYVVTENPWISNVSATPTSNDGTTNTVVSFTTDTGGTLYVFIGGSTTAAYTNTVTAGNITFSLTPAQLAEGNNEVLIIVADSAGREGRNGLVVTKSTVPETVSFDLGFGNASITVSIETLNRSDIANYTIFYSADLAEISSDPPTTATTAVITNFSINSTVNYNITGLVNGTTYYVRIRAYDDGGIPGPLSDIKSAMPQTTQSLTSLKGEKGCSMGSPSAAPGLEFWTLIAFALALFEALKLKVRRVRS